MYRKKERMGQREAKIVSLEDLVPQNHMLRKIEEAIDFGFICDEVKGMYSEIEWGKPWLHPVVRFAERQDVGSAYFRLHESQKAGDMETSERLWPSHFLSVFCFFLRYFEKRSSRCRVSSFLSTVGRLHFTLKCSFDFAEPNITRKSCKKDYL